MKTAPSDLPSNVRHRKAQSQAFWRLLKILHSVFSQGFTVLKDGDRQLQCDIRNIVMGVASKNYRRPLTLAGLPSR